ncbi:hypothetical protein F5X99DRAFT_428030 [Biscogniauxia marginata]|nr:hypothetical protein F5X99DRAFT_428030 [Biscogniauxia marginata]
MDTPLPTASGPTVNSPSDLSYSSGASRTSTRNTSPNSISAVSRHSSPLLSLNLKANIEHTPNTLLDSQTKMERNPFQSVNNRRNKLSTDRSTTSQFQHQQPLQPQVQPLRSSVQPLGPSRSLTSSNWRSHPIDDLPPQPRNMYGPFDSSGGNHHHTHHGAIRPTSYPSPRLDHHRLTGLTSYPNLGGVSDTQIDNSYAYCYDRGNGQYTRLIPADMLPPLRDIPAVQQSSSGMIVLPQPRAVPHSGRSSNTEPVFVRSPPTTPTSPADTIQSRIDNIVASTPPTPTHNPLTTASSSGAGPGPSTSVGPAGGGGGSGGGGSGGGMQHQGPGQGGGQRRPKIYCDKWVHEGVCAFTQQGCKYKHEMPFDKVTQHQLGLFHGFPAWWKKHQADLARHREPPPPPQLLDSSSGGGNHPSSAGESGGDGGGGGMMGEESGRLGGEGGDEMYMARGRGAGGSAGAGGRDVGGGGGSGGGGGNDLGGPGGVGGMGAADPANPLNWRRGGDYAPENMQAVGPPPMTTAGRSGMSRGGGMGASLRNPIVSYGSPFGPIAPPARSSYAPLMAGMTNLGIGPGAAPGMPASTTSTSAADPNAASSQGQKAGSSSSSSSRAASGIPTTNPYATLAALDENSADEARGSASNSNSAGARLT